MQASKINEVQYGSLSACKDTDIISCQSLIVKPDENNANQWTEIPLEDHRNHRNNTKGGSHNDTASAGSVAATNIFQTNAIIHSIVPFAQIRKGTCIRIPPMKWHCGGWDNQHFHDQLRIPFVVPPVPAASSSSGSSSSSTNVSSSSRGIVVTLEAMARECVAVALSPRPNFELGKTYVVHFGAASNVQTVIRRRLANPTDTVDVTLSSPHICSSEKFKAYWILLQNKGQVSVGVGKIPGKRCLGTLDDSMYHEIRSGVDAVKYVGLGNSALGRRAKDVKVRNVRVMSVPDAFAAFGGIPLTPYYHPNGYEDEDNCVDGDGVGVGQDQEEEKDAALWMEYSKECEKAKKRAEKFGIEYKQPQPDAFFTWSEARKMRANPERGFITGFDIMDEKEQEKQRKRKERFFGQDAKDDDDGDGDDDDMEEEEQRNDDYMLGERRNDHHNKSSNLQMVELSEAWDNEDLVGSMRVDPPECLWNKRSKSDAMEDDGNDQDPGDDMALEEENKDNSNDNNDHVKYVPTKIHLFAIDWAAFKQIRSDDILSYFRVYGPSYVEWLGELSCNIHFEDKFSASRALEGLSRVLPMEIPSTGGTKECKEIAKQGGEDVMVPSHHEEEEEGKKAISNTNLGIMGWRICNRPIYKIRSDRYGRRGTRSRCIVRIATSLDVLEERPSSFPKPPPGFTTHRVLGPGSDYSKTYSRRPAGPGNRYDRRGKGRQDKRRRRRRHESVSDDGLNHKEDDFDQSALDRALTAPRR